MDTDNKPNKNDDNDDKNNNKNNSNNSNNSNNDDDDDNAQGKSGSGVPTAVVVHPLVLLSVVDHYARVAKGTNKRVVGVLLGEAYKGTVDVTNSFAVPFEEDAKDSTIWFLDHNYLEQLHTMFKKVNARENIIGWYSTGVKVRSSDLEINELFRKYIANPILVVIDPVGGAATLGLPTKSYVAVDEVAESRDGVARSQRTFRHIGSSLGALEAEEVGVEHLLRDIRRLSTATLGQAVEARVAALRSLDAQLTELRRYVADVRDGRLPLSQRIVSQLQHAFNLAPAVNQPALSAAFAASTNDALLAIYTASLTRAIISLHTLLLNKRDLRERDRKDAAAEEAAALAKAAAKDKAASTTGAATTSDRTASTEKGGK